MYLQKRFNWRGSKLVRHGIQFVLMLFAWYTIMTRVSDYKHHWSDVLAGFSIGLLFAVVIVSILYAYYEKSCIFIANGMVVQFTSTFHQLC